MDSGAPGDTDFGFGPALSSTLLGEGANNRIFLLDYGTSRFVCKETRPDGVKRLAHEAGILSRLEPAIGPALRTLRSSPDPRTSDHLLEEHVVGTHDHILDATKAELFGRVLGRLHALPVEHFGDVVPRTQWREYIATRIDTQWALCRESVPQWIQDEMPGLIAQIATLGNKLASHLEARAPSLVHGDLIPLNVLSTPDGCRLIDWELARIDSPEWDIASVLKAFEFPDGSIDSFWRSYDLPCDPDILRFVSLLQYCNVALWRCCSYYVRHENHDIAPKFLSELEQEIEWVRTHLLAR